MHVELALEGDVLAVSFDLTDFASLDAGQLEALQQKLGAIVAGQTP